MVFPNLNITMLEIFGCCSAHLACVPQPPTCQWGLTSLNATVPAPWHRDLTDPQLHVQLTDGHCACNKFECAHSPGLNRRLFWCCCACRCAASGAPAGTFCLLDFLLNVKRPLPFPTALRAVCLVLAMPINATINACFSAVQHKWCTMWVVKLSGQWPNLYVG